MDHGDHGHDHHHGHEHSHAVADYFLEQLLTILVCGAFGVVAVLMYNFNMLNHILVPQFHLWVMLGGVVLLVFTAIRAIAIWREAGSHQHEHGHEHGTACEHHHGEHAHEHGAGCDHENEHGHAHSHSHGEEHGHAHSHSHGEEHGHEHGNVFWRVVVLAFPILLFCLGLPNEGFSKDWIERRLGKDEAIGDVKAVEEKGGDVITFDFAELNAAAYDPGKRASYEGRTVRVKGQLQAVGQREYTLFKLKMACCAADMIPLKTRIKTEFVSTYNNYDWVSVQGVLQFVEIPGQGHYLPVIRVKSAKDMQKTEPEV